MTDRPPQPATAPIPGAVAALRPPAPQRPPIRSIGEFVDCLQQLLNGHVLVRVSDLSGWTTLAGAAVYYSFDVLVDYGLIQEFDVQNGWDSVHYYQISPVGRDFALTVLARWASQPLSHRVWLRLLYG